MRRSDLNAGNAVLIALFVAVILMSLLFVQVTATRSNVAVIERRTQNAQMTVEATLLTRRTLDTVTRHLPAATGNVNASGLADDTLVRELSTQVQGWLSCEDRGRSLRLYVADQNTCGEPHPRPQGVTADPLRDGAARYRVPLLLSVTARSDEGRRTRQASGELRFTAGPALNISAFQVLAQELGAAVPAQMIFDGPVHVNGRPTLATGRSEWPGGLSTAADQIMIGERAVAVSAFAPHAAYPCDQTSATCPNFGGGLGMASQAVPLTSPLDSGALDLPGNIREVVLFPVAGDAGFLACTTTICDAYMFSGRDLRRIQSGVPVPAKTGGLSDVTPTESTVIDGVTTRMIAAPGDLQVRSLTPTGAAYSGAVTVQARGTLTVSSSLLASSPVCTTYSVITTTGTYQPAVCGGLSSPDGLGLISTGGNILLGDAGQALLESERSLSLQANLFAPRGEVRMDDPRLQVVDWIGAASAHTFTADARMRLAHDPRLLALPGFPGVANGLTPGRLVFDQDRPVQ